MEEVERVMAELQECVEERMGEIVKVVPRIEEKLEGRVHDESGWSWGEAVLYELSQTDMAEVLYALLHCNQYLPVSCIASCLPRWSLSFLFTHSQVEPLVSLTSVCAGRWVRMLAGITAHGGAVKAKARHPRLFVMLCQATPHVSACALTSLCALQMLGAITAHADAMKAKAQHVRGQVRALVEGAAGGRGAVEHARHEGHAQHGAAEVTREEGQGGVVVNEEVGVFINDGMKKDGVQWADRC
ncbi:unnamed protein product [Closterium sp. Yama58-4]|nr:unnamed protein product [Closterium sp. Yama58-4]